MTKRKFKLFLPSNIEKEEAWLTEMSKQGLHLKKYQLFTYVFEENPEESFVYQIDFRPDAQEDYFEIYKDAGWDYITNSVRLFHYFRREARQQDTPKIYSDIESIQDSFKRMIRYYLLIFFLFLIAQMGLVMTWQGMVIQYVLLGIDAIVVILYISMFIGLLKRTNFYRGRSRENHL